MCVIPGEFNSMLQLSPSCTCCSGDKAGLLLCAYSTRRDGAIVHVVLKKSNVEKLRRALKEFSDQHYPRTRTKVRRVRTTKTK